MAYNISTSNGQPLVTIADGSVDVNYTSLSLIGKNYSGYGQLLNENFVHLLENFASEAEPTNPIQGQIWYDAGAKILKVRTANNAWKPVSAVTSSVNTPINPAIGDQWWDMSNEQLKTWSGTEWIINGPAYTAGQGKTGTIPTILRESGTNIGKVVILFYINDQVTALWSSEADTFTVLDADKVDGFYTAPNPHIVKPGLTLANLGTYSTGTYTNIPRNMVWGTAEKALTAVALETNDYLYTILTGSTQVVNDTVNFVNDTALTVTGNIEPTNDITYNLGSDTKRFANVYANYLIADNVIDSSGNPIGGGGGGGSSNLDDLGDVVITGPQTGEVLKFDGTNWINGVDSTSAGSVSLDDLSDVTITSPASGQLLKFNGSGWVNTTIGLDGLTNVVLTSPSSGQVLKYDGTNWINGTDNAGSTGGQNVQVFFTSGTFNVPLGVSSVRVRIFGGGGGGGTFLGGNGGMAEAIVPVTPGASIAVTVGAGGGGSTWPGAGAAGGTSSFGPYLSATGGGGGNSPGVPGTVSGSAGVIFTLRASRAGDSVALALGGGAPGESEVSGQLGGGGGGMHGGGASMWGLGYGPIVGGHVYGPGSPGGDAPTGYYGAAGGGTLGGAGGGSFGYGGGGGGGAGGVIVFY